MSNSSAYKLNWTSEKRPIYEFLRKSNFFAGVSDEMVAKLADICSFQRFMPGTKILNAGTINNNVYFVLVGRVKVDVGGEIIANLGREGDIFGEMSVISQEPVSATIIAETPVELFSLDFKTIKEKMGSESVLIENGLFRVFAQLLTRKLAFTNEKAENFEKINRDLVSTHTKLQRVTNILESSLDERSTFLKEKSEELEKRNLELEKAQRRSEELLQTKELSFAKLKSFYEQHLPTLQQQLGRLEKIGDLELKSSIERVVVEIEELMEIMGPVSEWGESNDVLKSKHVLFVNPERKQQVYARLAWAAAVASLDYAIDEVSLHEILKSKVYDVICVDHRFIHLIDGIHKIHPRTEILVLISGEIKDSLKGLMALPYVTKLMSASFEDRNQTIKNFHTTLSKIANKDYFGIKKYLNTQVEIKKHRVSTSGDRAGLIENMSNYFKDIGVRPSIVDRASLVAEELLMNIIYDAPVDSENKSLYNQLLRTEEVRLKPNEQGEFLYACDGVTLAVSTIDPFGSLSRDTIFNYLESCYTDKAGTLNTEKGGAGRGLYMMAQNSDILIFNVKNGVQTEVICLFNVDMATANKSTSPSIHMFF